MVAKVNNIDISGFALKTICDTDKSDLEIKICDADKKIPNISELVKRTDYNVTITEIASKISSITGLATTAALTVVKIKYLMLVMSKKKQIIKQIYQTISLNILQQLITINLQMKTLI